MAFQQVRDIISQVRGFHDELAAFYQSLENVAEKERVRLILGYLKRHEETMSRALVELERQSAPRVLDAWMVYPPAQQVFDEIRSTRILPDMGPTEVVVTAIRLDDKIQDFLREAARQAATPRIREIFENLRAEGLSERSRMVLDVFEPE